MAVLALRESRSQADSLIYEETLTCFIFKLCRRLEWPSLGWHSREFLVHM
ncbi:hypothetical protein M6B38_347695 [Iris pallida]|uniref:Uncharacterized protein n=1 Tax=Iris pallida TaxID=29817 RepID=A0AAX6DVH2_IRIPA|nr:hypothetical protein M6B38_224435 [Iris pallida]KAJ6804038.1 hypothetical protein M6B38_186225 [Iris pallida]KAJ6831636.1 hypothetical protein M6B38_347695 [Iris pallida]